LLILALGAVSLQASAKTVKHTIKSGDTLSSIAHKHHTTIVKIRKANGLKKGEILKLGKVLTVPKDMSSLSKKKKVAKAAKLSKHKKIARASHKKVNNKRSSRSAKYIIKSGDTLSSIARKHHTTIAKIRKANGLKKGKILKLGRALKIPGSAYVKSKKIKIAKSKNKQNDKKLARALMHIKSKRTVKKKAAKNQKFASNDISFHGKSSVKGKKLIDLAKKKLGRRYVWGAVGQKNTFDCSGLTSYVCKKNGITIPRRAIAQSKYGKYVSRSHLKPGDLIFFDTSKRRRGYVNHVGIYLGNNKFIHASSAKHKVVITSLKKPFYSQRFKCGRRVAS